MGEVVDARGEAFLSPCPELWGRSLPEAMKKVGVPALSLAVLEDGRAVDVRAFGEAGEDTLFQAASVSKCVFAAAVVRLAGQKKLDLHEDIRRMLKKDYALPLLRGKEAKVTLAQLLSHTGGVDLHGFKGYPGGAQLPTIQETLSGKKPANNRALRFALEPGSEFLYSGGGYVLAQKAVEDALGKPLEAIAREQVFGPCAMEHSTFAPEPEGFSLAQAYRRFRRPLKGGYYRYPEAASSGLWTTAGDLARLASGICLSLQGKSLFLRPRDAKLFTQSYGKSPFSLGFMIQNAPDGSLCCAHTGGNEGFQSALRFFPDTGRGLVILTNSNSAFPLIVHTAYAVYDAFGWPYKPDWDAPSEKKRSLHQE